MALKKIVMTTVVAGTIGLGFLWTSFAQSDDHDHSTHSHDHSKLVSLPAGADAPSIGIEIVKDPVGGWNLHIITTNFQFAPEAVNQHHQAGQGHAHIYVNGKKLARVYGPWFHIGSLPKGNVEVKVTLNSNDHSGLAVGEKALAATMNVVAE
ncbi:MAG: hypothetical protein JKX93_06480 [Rhizobiaceae bacterium]|nr:hypothetical protein [Rhizobiaceae bacterium]